MASLPKHISNLSDLLSSLPGIGPKMSNRLALYLSVSKKNLAKSLEESLRKAVEEIRTCELCGNVSVENICDICADDARNKELILVVEDPLDLYNIEASGEYKGLYHVLNGVISPVNGVGPSDINMGSLIKRVKEHQEIKEIIIGLNPNLEGDSTSIYLKNELSALRADIKFTKLAKGIPSGSDIEFMSSQTLIESVNSRRDF